MKTEMDMRPQSESCNAPRILIFSKRNIFGNLHFRLGLYEFEDLICQVDSVKLLAPRPQRWFEYRDRFASRLASDFGLFLNPGIPRVKVREKYDLFFAIAQFPGDLLYLKNVVNWKEKCEKSVCWLNEIWLSDINDCRHLLEILSDFDYVVVHLIGSLSAVQARVRGKCFYLPYGIDAISFCPYPELPPRGIDVYSIGRKSLKTHETLMRMMESDKLFYVYDTIDGEHVFSPREHRFLFSNMVKRSRYFIVNPGRRSRADITQGQIEFGNRFFEGAAAGAVMIGERPDNREFDKHFDWLDSVVNVPFGSEHIDEVIRELDKQPERQQEIRKNNVVQSLMRHDWVYRWEAVLKIAGLDPTPKLLERRDRLQNMAEKVNGTVLP